MTWTRPKVITASLAALLLLAIAAVYIFLVNTISDRYIGEPQVVGLPEGYDPKSAKPPFRGVHPSLTDRPGDPYAYPIAVGAPGPVTPTFIETWGYPFACRTEGSLLGQPLVDNQDGAGVAVYAEDNSGNKTEQIIGFSKDCSVNTRVIYYYRQRDTGKFLPFDSQNNDVEQISLDGQSIPFVVRLEIGTINRHVYVIAHLRGPDDQAEKPDMSFWNRKLIYQFRGGVGIGRRQGRITPDYIPSRRHAELAQGYAIAHSTANQTSTSYDIELAEDTLARVKRQFTARYGAPKYTIGIGGSGGAIQQYLIGQNRPGLLDAGVALYSYPDMITQTTRVMDCELLEYFFDIVDGDNAKWQKWSRRSWIEGFNARDDLPNSFERIRALQSIRLARWPTWSRGHTECTRSWRNLTPQILNPHYTYFASLFAADVATLVPFTYWDNLKRVYGTDEDGFARRTYDNVGVQYGLAALKRQQITIAEFLKLNDNIGGWKEAIDMAPERYWRSGGAQSNLADIALWSQHNMTATASAERPAKRSEGDLEAIEAAYRSGHVFIGKLSMPVVDLRHYLEPELNMHHSLQSFSARLRMQRQQGHADEQIIWFAKDPYSPIDKAIGVLERWIENMRENSGSSIGDARPGDAVDQCFDDQGQQIASGNTVWNGVWNGKENGACMDVYPIYSNPRIVAGDNYVGDIFKCHLQSIDEAIVTGVYAPIDVAAHRNELQRIFPDGVCNYSRGDVGRPADLQSDPPPLPSRSSPANP